MTPSSLAQLLERHRRLAVEPVAPLDDVAHPRLERGQGRLELARPVALGGDRVGRGRALVLDQVGVQALAVPDRASRARPAGRRARAARRRARPAAPSSAAISVVGRVAVELLGERPAGAQDAPHLLADVHGQADRPALVGERPRDRLADPPGRVGREPVAHPVVELLDRPDQAHVALLDQVEQRHVGARVVARDRHHEAQVRLDQPPLGRPRRRGPCAGRARAPRRRSAGGRSRAGGRRA